MSDYVFVFCYGWFLFHTGVSHAYVT